MTGRVTRQRDAVVGLRISAPSGRVRTVKAVVDTGFSESLALPLHTVALLDLPPRGVGKAIMADGSEATLPVFWAIVEWHGVRRLVSAYGMGGSALIGMALLEGSDLAIRAANNGPVRIEPISSP